MITLPAFPEKEKVFEYHLIDVRTQLDNFGIADPSVFAAKLQKDGIAIETHGRETQVYGKMNGRWRPVHVHYSGMPVAPGRAGF